MRGIITIIIINYIRSFYSLPTRIIVLVTQHRDDAYLVFLRSLSHYLLQSNMQRDSFIMWNKVAQREISFPCGRVNLYRLSFRKFKLQVTDVKSHLLLPVLEDGDGGKTRSC